MAIGYSDLGSALTAAAARWALRPGLLVICPRRRNSATDCRRKDRDGGGGGGGGGGDRVAMRQSHMMLTGLPSRYRSVGLERLTNVSATNDFAIVHVQNVEV